MPHAVRRSNRWAMPALRMRKWSFSAPPPLSALNPACICSQPLLRTRVGSHTGLSTACVRISVYTMGLTWSRKISFILRNLFGHDRHRGFWRMAGGFVDCCGNICRSMSSVSVGETRPATASAEPMMGMPMSSGVEEVMVERSARVAVS